MRAVASREAGGSAGVPQGVSDGVPRCSEGFRWFPHGGICVDVYEYPHLTCETPGEQTCFIILKLFLRNWARGEKRKPSMSAPGVKGTPSRKGHRRVCVRLLARGPRVDSREAS